MRVTILLLTVTTWALAQKDCNDISPVQCGRGEMVCEGGFDALGCPEPDFCIPTNGTSNMIQLLYLEILFWYLCKVH